LRQIKRLESLISAAKSPGPRLC